MGKRKIIFSILLGCVYASFASTTDEKYPFSNSYNSEAEKEMNELKKQREERARKMEELFFNSEQNKKTKKCKAKIKYIPRDE